LEELVEQHFKKDLGKLNANQPADRQLRFIRGDQIRDDQNHKLTDGLLAWQDRNSGDLHILQAFEAKACHQAVRELNRTLDELTLSGKEETRRYARDLARDELLGAQRENETLDQYQARQAEQLRNLSDEERRRLERRTRDHFEELLSRRVQTELGGQVQKTIERLHESTEAATRILVDGKEARLAVDRGRTDVVKVVPQDVHTRDLEALRLPHRARDLQIAAEAIVDELRRRGII
jgi:flagellar motility protein MotE (MotC chaperone)